MTARRNYERDQALSPFTPVLAELCRASGACSAALVDQEGETVDYAGRGDPFEIRVLAAELRLLLQHTKPTVHFSRTSSLMIRARRGSFFILSLPEGYALVVRLGRRAAGISERCLSIAVRELCEEAGFSSPRSRRSDLPPGVEPPRQWRRVRVEVEEGQTRRPRAVETNAGLASVEVMGRVAGEGSRREQGFRVRLTNGEEGTLVRERLGRWYLEEDLWE
ncbi:MAG TPA: hypothetical protein VLC09_01045 [Polyangiaceae bacterium]|nr:hypothetical protein [Polyangiaceae bacterium]